MSIWHSHTAPFDQPLLPFNAVRRRRKACTQADVLLEMLRAARAERSSLDLPSIMRAGIAQHSARFNELRAQGLVIENEMARANGVVRSSYRLTFDPEVDRR